MDASAISELREFLRAQRFFAVGRWKSDRQE